jgi:predicted RNase H-like HicB family nuclease
LIGGVYDRKLRFVSEIIFEVQEDEIDGGYVATARGYGIVTQGDTVEGLRAMVKDAVHCYFGDSAPGRMPKIIRLHFGRDEVLAA